MEDLLGQHEAEKSKLSSSLAALETTRSELEHRIAVLTDKLNEKNDDTGIGGYHLILIRGPFHRTHLFFILVRLFGPFMIIYVHNMIRKYHIVRKCKRTVPYIQGDFKKMFFIQHCFTCRPLCRRGWARSQDFGDIEIGSQTL